MQSKHKTQLPSEPFVRRHRPFFVTLFVLIPVIAMPALLLFTALKSDSLQKWCALHVFYENSQGLKKGNPVSISGITVGHVKVVDLIKEKEVYVCINVNSRYKHLVRKDTKARLKQRGFVGDWEIELTGGTSEFAEAEDNDTLRSDRMPSMDDLIELGVGIIDTGIVLLNDISAIVAGIEAGEGTVGELMKSDTLIRIINRLGANAIGITSDVKKLTTGAQGTVRNVDSLLVTLTGAGKGGTAVVDTLMALINSVNKTIDEVMVEIDAILKNARTMVDDAPELMDRLQYDLGQVEIMLKSFQDGWLFKTIGGEAPKNPHLADSP